MDVVYFSMSGSMCHGRSLGREGSEARVIAGHCIGTSTLAVMHSVFGQSQNITTQAAKKIFVGSPGVHTR